MDERDMESLMEQRKVFVFVSVRDRVRQTRNCISSLLETAPDVHLSVYDNDSGSELQPLLSFYQRLLELGSLDSLVLTRTHKRPEIYWSKNYAWGRFIDTMTHCPQPDAKDDDILIMVDNDVVFHPGWLEAGLGWFDTLDPCKLPVVSPYDGPPIYETDEETLDVDGNKIAIRKRLTSRCWMARASWWASFTPPVYTIIERDGKPDRYPTDNWYYEQMATRDQRFAVLQPPLVTDPSSPWPSARAKHQIGADFRK